MTSGHRSITITLDRYGHLFPGNEDEAAGLLDAYLARANTQARLAQVDTGRVQWTFLRLRTRPARPGWVLLHSPTDRGENAIEKRGLLRLIKVEGCPPIDMNRLLELVVVVVAPTELTPQTDTKGESKVAMGTEVEKRLRPAAKAVFTQPRISPGCGRRRRNTRAAAASPGES